jgi:hypothetical protein
MRICSGPGCLRAVPDDVRFCDECRVEHNVTPHAPRTRVERGRTDPMMLEYGTKRWQTVRRIALLKQPYCIGWRMTCQALSVVGDHNIPARTIVPVCRALGLFPMSRFPGFYVASNIVGLCHACHNRKTLVEDKCDWTEALVTTVSTYLSSVKDAGERRAKIISAYAR